MGAVLQILPGHDLLHKGQQFFFVVDPTGLDGGFAGNCMEQFVPDSFFLFPAAGQKIGGREAAFGILIAVPNFFSSKFLLGALESLSAVIVYPVFSVGTILTVTLTGVLAFRERLDRKQWIGVAVILTALVLLNV